MAAQPTGCACRCFKATTVCARTFFTAQNAVDLTKALTAIRFHRGWGADKLNAAEAAAIANCLRELVPPVGVLTHAASAGIAECMTTGKYSVKNNAADLKTQLDALIDAIKLITVTPGSLAGPSSVPLNVAVFDTIKAQIGLILEAGS